MPAHLRALHGAGYKLVVFAEDARIRQSCEGKAAQLRMSLVDWVATEAGVPIHAVVACEKNAYRRPEAAAWRAMEEQCNGGVRIAPKRDALFVGGAADPDGQFGDTDLRFAEAVGMTHATPEQVYVHD